MILVDAHVHIHDCFDLEQFFHSAYANFKFEAERLNNRNDFTGILLLAETSKENWFYRFADYADGKSLPKKKRAEAWTFHRTKETRSLYVKYQNKKKFFLIAGRQVETAEGLEVLGLFTNDNLEDSTPMIELIESIKGIDGIPVIPWGFGKWFGKRGNVLTDYLKTRKNSEVFLGDNSSRPIFMPLPSHFQFAKKKSIHILPGSDPLPFVTENNRGGGFGFSLLGKISEDYPAKELKQILMEPNLSIKPYGDLENIFRFFRNQIKIQLKKRLSN
jgi:hypothetical protein